MTSSQLNPSLIHYLGSTVMLSCRKYLHQQFGTHARLYNICVLENSSKLACFQIKHLLIIYYSGFLIKKFMAF